MKRSREEIDMDGTELSYHEAVRKAQLVQRNPHPNGHSLVDPLRVSMHNKEDIISLATQIENADRYIKTSTCQKLGVILDQIKMLQAQAQAILKESEQCAILHNASCNFIKRPGHIYHLYQKESGENYFSMLSPEEWNSTTKQKHLGSYRLESDLTWTPLERIEERDQKMLVTEKFLNASQASHGNRMAIDFDV